MAPQAAHAPRAVVSSLAKTLRNIPAAALPSSLSCDSSIYLPSCRTEALSLDAIRRISQLHQNVRDCLDQRSGSTHHAQWLLRCWEGYFREDVAVDPPRKAVPSDRLASRQRQHDLQAIRVPGELVKLVLVNHLLRGASGIEQTRWNEAAS